MGLQRWRCAKGHLCRWRSSLPDAGILTVRSLTGARQPQSAEVRALPDFQPWLALHCQLDVLSFIHVTPRSPCQAPRSCRCAGESKRNSRRSGGIQLQFCLGPSFAQVSSSWHGARVSASQSPLSSVILPLQDTEPCVGATAWGFKLSYLLSLCLSVYVSVK